MANNPVDQALEAVGSDRTKAAQQRKQDEHTLWTSWKENPNEETLGRLVQHHEPLIRQKLQQYRAPAVSQEAMRGELKLRLMDAYQAYDPSRGASLRTFAEQHLVKAQRYNTRYQNYAYLPEGQTQYIGSIDRAKDALRDQGVEPTHQLVAQHINQSPDLLGGKKTLTAKRVKAIEQGRRADIMASAFETDPAPYEQSHSETIMGLLRPALKPEAHPVFDHIYGLNGAPQIAGTNELAKKLNMSASQVSRMKTYIANEYNKYK